MLCPLCSTGKKTPDQNENVGSLGKLSCATYTPYLSIYQSADLTLYLVDGPLSIHPYAAPEMKHQSLVYQMLHLLKTTRNLSQRRQ